MTNLHEVTEWIDALLEGGASFGATATLRQCMEFGASDVKLSVIDAEGGKHGLGDTLYETAFLTALRELVLVGVVGPAPDSEKQQQDWRAWMDGAPEDGTTCDSVLEVPLRCLREAGEPEQTKQDRVREYLLGILKAEGAVRFSRFYNDETDYAKLAAEAGIDEADVEHAHIIIEDDAQELRRLGIVTFTTLPDRLIDGENDYLIELTENGRLTP